MTDIKKIDTPKINNMMKMYVISILVIIFQLSNQLFLNFIVNKQLAGYKPDAELMGYIYSKTPYASTIYFGNKILNIISLFSLAILYVILVVKGTFYNFSDRIIEKEKSFKDILVTIVIFLFIAIFSNLFGTISRLFLPSDKYGEISVVDTILNIDSILLYFSSSKSTNAECIENKDYKLSDSFDDEKKIFYGGGLLDSNPINNLFGNMREIFGIGLFKNLRILISLITYFIYIFVVFVLLFNQFDSSYVTTPNNINVYGKLYKAFIGCYVSIFIIFGIIFIATLGVIILKVMSELDESLSIVKKLESLFRNPLFIFMIVIWVILLILVIIFGSVPTLKSMKGSKTFTIIGIVIIVLLFVMVLLFLFEPIKQLYMKITGITDINQAPDWFKNIFQKSQERDEGKSLQNIITETKNMNNAYTENNKKTLEEHGPNAHLLRGLLGSIGVNSDLLKNRYTANEVNELEKIVIEGLASKEKRKQIIEKLKEIHLTNRGIGIRNENNENNENNNNENNNNENNENNENNNNDEEEEKEEE